MSVSLSEVPGGTTANAQVVNACLPAGELRNKTPIYISDISDTRSFLARLRANCPGGLMVQLKNQKWIIVPSTADGITAAISGLWSLYGKDGVSFQNFMLP